MAQQGTVHKKTTKNGRLSIYFTWRKSIYISNTCNVCKYITRVWEQNITYILATKKMHSTCIHIIIFLNKFTSSSDRHHDEKILYDTLADILAEVHASLGHIRVAKALLFSQCPYCDYKHSNWLPITHLKMLIKQHQYF